MKYNKAIFYLFFIIFCVQSYPQDLSQTEQNYQTQDPSNCGAHSLYVTAKLLGLNLDLDKLEKELNPNKEGNSMYDLFVKSQELGFSVVGLRLSYDELIKLDSPAIAYVRGNHFFVVEKSIGDKIRVINYPHPATIMDRDSFERIWRGEVLVISRPKSAFTQMEENIKIDGPKIKIMNDVHDFGSIGAGQTVQHIFEFQNIGTEPLLITKIDPSCGLCTGTLLAKTTIAPGNTGQLEVKYQSSGRQGMQSESVILHTNDPMHPRVVFNLIADVKVEYQISPSTLSFGEVHYQSTAERILHLIAQDKPDIMIRKIESGSPYISVVVEEIHEKSNPDEKKRYAIKTLLIPGESLGQFTTRLMIHTNGNYQPVSEIMVSGNIIGDIQLTPNRFFLGLITPGKEISRTITLTGYNNHSFQIISYEKKLDITLFDDAQLDLQEIQPGKQYKLVLSGTPAYNTGTVQGSILLQTDNPLQPLLEIPVYGLVR